jgi:hypothetical protein
MSYIYIIVEDSDQERLLLSQYDKNDCKCAIEEIYLRDWFSNKVEISYRTMFIFDLAKDAGKAKDFLQRCHDNPIESSDYITLNLNKTKCLHKPIEYIKLDKNKLIVEILVRQV